MKNNVFFNVLIGIILFLAIPTSTLAQEVIENTAVSDRIAGFNSFMEMKNNSPFKNLPWQFVGPTNVSGRMTDVAVTTPKGKNYTIYVAGASGGIWKSENEGTSWKSIFDQEMTASIGDIAIDPQDQNTIWAGTGEGNIFRSSQTGAGIFKSTDGGNSWKHMGLIDTNTISRILIHPKNSDIVYVAASGHEWTKNEERGLYKTTDGGQTWVKIKFVDEMTAANDIVMDPTNPEIIYLSTWQRIRKKYNDPRTEADYTGTGLHKSTDGGNTWTEINKGLPSPQHRGRIGIDLCNSEPNVIYAFVDNYEKLPPKKNEGTDAYGRPSSGRIKGATLYKSTDAGLNWKQTSANNAFMEGLSGTYGWVFGQVRVDPINSEKVYLMGLGLHVSNNSGKTFKTLRGMHGDHHGLWIDPQNTNYLVNVNDGGLAISYDGGKKFRTFYDELPLVQFFNVNVDMSTPFKVYGSIQDHGSRKGIVDLTRGRNNIPAVDFENAPGGEGSNHEIDPSDPSLVYSAGFYGTISQTNIKSGKRKNIMPPTPAGVDRLRGQWLAPFLLSPHNPRIIYHGTQFVHRSMDQGKKWEKISPDLTYNHESMKGDIPYQTIFSISESPFKFGLLYAGTDDGRVWRTNDGGSNWKEINKGLPFRKWVSRIVASKFSEGTVYMAQNGKRDDDFAVYLWKSEDFGENWKSIASNIPIGPVNVIREDPNNKNILYVGTDNGVFVSLNKGDNWFALTGNLPNTYVQDLVVHPRDAIMVAATHGRGIWAIDVSFVQSLSENSFNETGIIQAVDGRLPLGTNWWQRNTGSNAHIAFNLNNSAHLKLAIKDNSGAVLKEEMIDCIKGLNFYHWNLQGKNGQVEPGEYSVEITIGKKIFSKYFSVKN